MAKEGHVLDLIDRCKLWATGIGYTDAHLLASALLTPGGRLWTRDKRCSLTLNDSASRLRPDCRTIRSQSTSRYERDHPGLLDASRPLALERALSRQLDPDLSLYARFAAQIGAVLDSLEADGSLPPGLDRGAVTVEPPRDPSHGDLAVNAAMVLAKRAGPIRARSPHRSCPSWRRCRRSRAPRSPGRASSTSARPERLAQELRTVLSQGEITAARRWVVAAA
jgi:hypothetical protein